MTDEPARIVAEGLDSPEAPVWLGEGCWLVVEMAPHKGCVTALDPNGQPRTVATTGRPNGLALTPDGSVLVAESKLRALVQLQWQGEEAGSWEIVADRDESGQPLLFPNDLCFAPDGSVYLTDSGLTLPEMERSLLTVEDPSSLPFDGRVYRFDLATRHLVTIEGGLGHLNGISIGADNALYVSDTISGDVYRYPQTNGGLGARETFGNVVDRSQGAGLRGPDGMAHDVEGNLYVTVFNQGEVVVLGPDGSWVERIPTLGTQPTNVAFAGEEPYIYVTERESATLQRLPALAPGLPLAGRL